MEFHSVMYKASDVIHPSSGGDCASQRLHDHGGLHFHTKHSVNSKKNNVFNNIEIKQHGAVMKESALKDHLENEDETPFSSKLSSTQSRNIHPKLLVSSSYQQVNNNNRSNIDYISRNSINTDNHDSNINNSSSRLDSSNISQHSGTTSTRSSASSRASIPVASNGFSDPTYTRTQPADHVFHSRFFKHTRRKRYEYHCYLKSIILLHEIHHREKNVCKTVCSIKYVFAKEVAGSSLDTITFYYTVLNRSYRKYIETFCSVS